MLNIMILNFKNMFCTCRLGAFNERIALNTLKRLWFQEDGTFLAPSVWTTSGMWHFGDQGSGEFSSFGFRGEALSAISAMGDMTIATKTPESAAFPQQKDRHLLLSWLVWIYIIYILYIYIIYIYCIHIYPYGVGLESVMVGETVKLRHHCSAT